jgi:hypothetical protein
VGQDFERIRLEADRMQYQIDRMKAELKVLGDRLMTGDLEREVSAAELQEMKALYRDVDAAVAEVVEERRQRLLELSIAETEVGLGDATARSEATIRDRYRELLRKGEGFLRPYRSSVDPGSRTALESIDADRAALLRAGSGLDSYFAELEKTIEMKVADLQKEVAAEYSLLAMHRQSLEELVDSGGAGILAYLNFVRVHKDFRAVVLRGDVGLIDVMWQKKEQMSNKISQLFEDRSGELRALQESFEEVR